MGARERLAEVRAGKKNVGGTERIARGVVGPSLIALGVAALSGLLSLAAGTAGIAIAVLAILAGARMTVTAVTQRCYMNAIIGRDTCTIPGGRSGPGVEGEA